MQIIRQINTADDGVLAQLADRQNVLKAIGREKTKGMPTNPLTVEDMGEIPATYQ